MWWSVPPQSSLDFSSSLRSFWSPSTSFTWYTTSPGVAPKMDAPTMFSFEVQPFHFLSWINSNFLSKLQMFLSALPPQQKVRFWIDRKELHGNLSKKKFAPKISMRQNTDGFQRTPPWMSSSEPPQVSTDFSLPSYSASSPWTSSTFSTSSQGPVYPKGQNMGFPSKKNEKRKLLFTSVHSSIWSPLLHLYKKIGGVLNKSSLMKDLETKIQSNMEKQ